MASDDAVENFLGLNSNCIALAVIPTSIKGGRHLKPQKFENIFVAVITFFLPFFCANNYYTSLLLIVCALR